MHYAFRLLLPLAMIAGAFAQSPGLTLPPSGNNQKASVSQWMGPVQVTIEYSAPAVHGPDGRDRRGQIWGKLVPYGVVTLDGGNGKPSPWRAGANENTVFAVSHDVLIEGKPLPAGRYGLHMIPGPEEWTLVLSRNSNGWGSYFYEPSEDALRVPVKPRKHEYQEWLTYAFTTRRLDETTAELQWEELAVPWTVKVGNIKDVYVSKLRQDLTTGRGFEWQSYIAAAQYCVDADTNLDQALAWTEIASTRPGIGVANFATLSMKARILGKMKRDAEAKTAMQAALSSPGTTPIEIHQYGRQLLAEKKTAEAMEVFQYNAKRNGETWPVHVGLARGYAALGDNQKALEHARKALPQAPDELNKKSLAGMVEALSQGKTLN